MLNITTHEGYLDAIAALGDRALTTKQLAEEIVKIHYAVATSDNSMVAYCESQTYQLSQFNLLATLGMAYPRVPADEIYDVWLDCNETIEYCVNAVLNRGEGLERY